MFIASLNSAVACQYGKYEQNNYMNLYYTNSQLSLPIYGGSMRKLKVDTTSDGSYVTNDYDTYINDNGADDNVEDYITDSDANNNDIKIQLSPPYVNKSSYNLLFIPLLLLLNFANILMFIA
jgi:hypothetical protein